MCVPGYVFGARLGYTVLELGTSGGAPKTEGLRSNKPTLSTVLDAWFALL